MGGFVDSFSEPISEEEIEYHKKIAEEAAAKVRRCGFPGCGAKLNSRNKTDFCALHGGWRDKPIFRKKIDPDWKLHFMEAYVELKGRGITVTKKSLQEHLPDSSVESWINRLKEKGKEYITVDSGQPIYSLTGKVVPQRVRKEVRQVVASAKKLGKKATKNEIKGDAGLTITPTVDVLKEAVNGGYLKITLPIREIKLTKKGEALVNELVL